MVDKGGKGKKRGRPAWAGRREEGGGDGWCGREWAQMTTEDGPVRQWLLAVGQRSNAAAMQPTLPSCLVVTVGSSLGGPGRNDSAGDGSTQYTVVTSHDFFAARQHETDGTGQDPPRLASS